MDLRILRASVFAMAVLGACAEPPVDPGMQPPEPPSAMVVGAAGSDPTVEIPLGVGGSYTLLPRGGYYGCDGCIGYVQPPFTDLLIWGITPPLPTGIVLPVGAPVRVIATGIMTYEPTQTLLDRCGPCTDPLVRGEFAAWGLLSYYHLGQLVAAWGPDGDRMNAADSSVVLMAGPVGGDGELYLGRGSFGLGYLAEPDAYYAFNTFAGRFIVTVQAEDGSDSLFQHPKVWVAASPTRPAPGGPVTATLVTADGSVPTDVAWYYVPDVVSGFDGNPPVVAAAARGAAPGAGVEIAPGVAAPATAGPWTVSPRRDGGWTVVDASSGSVTDVAPGGTPTGGAPLMPGVTAPTPGRLETSAPPEAPALPIPIVDCAGQVTCTASVSQAGSFFVVLRLGGALYSASNYHASAATPLELHLTCPTVPRGEAGTCVTSVTPDGTDFQTTAWRFEPADASLPVVNRPAGEGGNHDWGGVLVASGTVFVTATVGNAELSTSAALTVTPRNWEGKAVGITVAGPRCAGPNELPVHPTKDENLGHAAFVVQPTAPLGYGSGPNEGYWYLTDIPGTVYDTVTINCAALQQGSDFWRLQDQETGAVVIGTRSCTRADIPRIEALVKAHEGLRRDAAGSHAQTYMDEFERLAGPRFESVVGAGTVTWAPGDDLDSIGTAAAAYSRQTTDSGPQNPFTPGCRIRYFPQER